MPPSTAHPAASKAATTVCTTDPPTPNVRLIDMHTCASGALSSGNDCDGSSAVAGEVVANVGADSIPSGDCLLRVPLRRQLCFRPLVAATRIRRGMN